MALKLSNEVKVGLLAIAGIVLFIFGFNYLKGKNILSKGNYYYATFKNLRGLDPTDAIEYRGFELGTVAATQMANSGQLDSMFVVKLKISSDIKFPKDTRAKIVSSSIMGGVYVQLVKGSSSEFASPGDTLLGESEASLTKQISEELRPLTDEMTKLIDSLKVTVGSIAGIFNDKNKENLSRAMTSIPRTLESFNHAAQSMANVLEKQNVAITKTMANLQSITENVKNNNEHISGILDNVDVLSKKLASSNVDKTIDELQGTLAELTLLLDKANTPEGSFHMLLTDPVLYQNLKSVSARTDVILKQLEENPGKYIPLKRNKDKRKNR